MKFSHNGKRGTLIIISIFLVLSAILRFGLSANEAFALAAIVKPMDPMQATNPSEVCAPPPDLGKALSVVKTKNLELIEREKSIQTRETDLAIIKDAIEAKLTELLNVEEQLRETISLADRAAESDVQNLTAVYSSMKPKEAAELFEEMDVEFAAGFLSLMAPQDAAPIMAELSPAKAYALSAKIAGRSLGLTDN